MKVIAQFMAFYFLLGSFLPGADFGQLSKLSAAIQHFQLHKELAADQGDAVSFHYFMGAHFWNPDHHDHGDGGQSHKDLPLKHVHSFDHLVMQAAYTISCMPAETVHQLTEKAHRFLPHLHLTPIFRPPIQA
jgi:hypothetical protein